MFKRKRSSSASAMVPRVKSMDDLPASVGLYRCQELKDAFAVPLGFF
jgi:hypothetical protein